MSFTIPRCRVAHVLGGFDVMIWVDFRATQPRRAYPLER